MSRALPGAARVLAVLAAFVVAGAAAQQRVLPQGELRSGVTFAGADVRAMQADDLANPGFLWVESGEKLWNMAAGAEQRSCASCHGDTRTSMRGVAARYPRHDEAAGLLDLEARIGRCRVERQKAAPWARESEELLAVTTFVAFQSRGLPLAVSIDGPARAAFERGRAFYATRHGQMNLACTQCHDANWGKRLLNETISQGHGNAFPAYRLEWQGMGSLQRRIRACLFGIRAEMPPPGAPELSDVELYLAWRAQGLPLEAPGVRR
jgi:sulfur-oxidizing protein SoxA